MRTYGRIANEDGTYKWVVVTTDAEGHNDAVWLTTLIQCLKLSPNESPFYADYGIPAQLSVIQQVFPDYYVALMQQRFAPYFSSLQISRLEGDTPVYQVNVTTQAGAILQVEVPV